ncbi:MAG TPA: 3',5'-cyclic-nucleotide phosphodiesterase [Myxococcaceae bacterium]|nr:3',5'-cyclic-nucleotide phosphodiesterase [Myxococcaceae bacterium]
MKLHVLGCHGGELPSCRSTCFLVDDVLALDAGALTSTLPLERLAKVDHVLLTHSHFDHVKDLPLMADLLVGRRTTPVTIWASHDCARALRASMFNDDLWPDFTRIPSAKAPVLKIRSFRPGQSFQVGPYRVKSVPVSHPVESCGFLVTKGETTLGISGDTGPTEALWKAANRMPGLKAMLVETSFPNALQTLADISGHLTPQTLEVELTKFKHPTARVMLYHLKPAFVDQLKAEVAHLPVLPLELDDVFEL